MDYEYLKEITEWKGIEYSIGNHTYIVEKKTGHLAGFIRDGTTEEIWYTKPLKQFSKARRKFIKINA